MSILACICTFIIIAFSLTMLFSALRKQDPCQKCNDDLLVFSIVSLFGILHPIYTVVVAGVFIVLSNAMLLLRTKQKLQGGK